MDSTKNAALWVLYDFANSIIAVVFFLYFAQWAVVDRGVSDFAFNLTFTASAVLLLFTVPLTGYLLDKHLRRITGIRYTTVLTAIFYGLCAYFALNNNDIAALACFTIGLYSYLLSFTFYTPLLNDIAKPARRGLLSGLGISANYLGQIAGLFLVLPFAEGGITWFGGAPRAETLLPAVVAFFALSLPMLFFFTEPKKTMQGIHLPTTLRELFADTRLLLSSASVGFFLLSYFLFNDAIQTAANNFPIFMEQVWQLSDTTKTYVLLGILLTSAIGGTVSGLIADRFGHKRTLLWILVGWAIILPLVGILTNFTLFVIVTTIMGLWLGACWTVSRTVMADIAPAGKHNLAFAYFGLAERASSFVGPLTWGLIVSGLTSFGPTRYRIAVLAVTVFIIIGIWALLKVKEGAHQHKIGTADSTDKQKPVGF